MVEPSKQTEEDDEKKKDAKQKKYPTVQQQKKNANDYFIVEKVDPEKKKKENLAKLREKFKDKGTRLALFGAINEKVKCACQSTDHLLGQKRTR